MTFVNLNIHTEYSQQSSVGKIDLMVEQASKLEQPWLGIADYGTINGAYRFSNLCKENGIKPVIGCTFYITNKCNGFRRVGEVLDKIDERIKETKKLKISSDKKSRKLSKLIDLRSSALEKRKNTLKVFHIIAIAKNIKGLQKLYKIVRDASDNFYYVPRTDFNLFNKYECQKDIVFVVGNISTELGQSIVRGRLEEVSKILKKFERYEFDYIFEISPHPIPGQERLNQAIVKLSKKYDREIITSNNVHYPHSEDYSIIEIIRSTIKGPKDLLQIIRRNSHLRTEQEMLNAFRKNHSLDNNVVDKAIENTEKFCETYISDRYDFDETDKLPKLYGIESKEKLTELTKKGLSRLGLINSKKYRKRIARELKIIAARGFCDYFLIVSDIVNWAKLNGITTGFSRGSVGGSLVAYTTGITKLDPLKYNLLFERFLTEDMTEYPDIDIDFEKSRRDEILQYLKNKYGESKVCQIGTNMRYKVSSSTRVIAKEFGVFSDELNEAFKTFNLSNPIGTLDDALEYSEIAEFFEKHPKILTIVKRILGQIYSSGCHASGIAISNRDLINDTPIVKKRTSEHGEIYVTGYVDGKDERGLTKLGILKIDRLGLTNLDACNQCIKYIKERYKETIILENIDVSDKKVFKNFQKGKTNAVFQFSKKKTKDICKSSKPKSIEDLSCITAVNRPGPLDAGLVEEYVYNKRNINEIESIYSVVDKILEPTYGVILYQEQVMQIAQKLAGFSSTESNHLRKIIKKSSGSTSTTEEREENKRNFMKGCRRNNIDLNIASRIFDICEKFAAYSFNKSHSISYSILAYCNMWLKTYYPLEYFAAYLKFQDRANDAQKITYKQIIIEASNFGIKFKTPNINTSGSGIQLEDDYIMFGISDIKGLGPIGSKKVVNNRPYTSFTNFLQRIPNFMGINKNVIRSMIVMGCFDKILEVDKKMLLSCLDDILKNKRKIHDESALELMIEDYANEEEEINTEDLNKLLTDSFGIGIKFFIDR